MRLLWNAHKVIQLKRTCSRACLSLRTEKSFHLLIFGFFIGILISKFYDISNEKTKINSGYKEELIERNYTNRQLKDKLFNEVRILCWVLTQPSNHQTKVVNILKAWGSRCNKILIISSKADEKLGIIGVPVEEGRKKLWIKVRLAFKYIYDNYADKYDWIFKADDDTYVVVDNARMMLYEYDPRTPIWFGFKSSAYVQQGYFSGGAGYVMSNVAMKRFVEVALPNITICNVGTILHYAEDLEMGKCLENVGVIAGDSRDIDNRGRFFLFSPEEHLTGDIVNLSYWYYNWMYYKAFDGLNCCSEYAISFHYTFGKIIDLLDYLIYYAKPYGIEMHPRKLPTNKIYIKRENPQKKID